MRYMLTLLTSQGANIVFPIEVMEGERPQKVASAVAREYGSQVVSVVKHDPVCHRTALRECLGFVEAWKNHLSDIGEKCAAQTVSSVLDRARDSYAVIPNPIRTRHVEEVILQNAGYDWRECEGFPLSAWQHEVATQATRLGYWEWVASKLETAKSANNVFHH